MSKERIRANVKSFKQLRIETARRLTNAQRIEYANIVRLEFASGLTAAEIAEKHKMSTSSVYRWTREAEKYHMKDAASYAKEVVDIDQTILKLCNRSCYGIEEICDAVFHFITWLRWPNDRYYQLIGTINCAMAYINKSSRSKCICDIQKYKNLVINKYIDTSILERLTSINAPINPDFGIITASRSRYSDLDFYAEAFHYLVSDHNQSQNSFSKATISKLMTLVSNGTFGDDWRMSSRTFQNAWSARSSSIPFLYVEKYHSELDFGLNPVDADFVESVDFILSNCENVTKYLSKVSWIIGRLEHKLDKRSYRRIKFPRFPQSHEPYALEIPPLSDRLLRKIQALK